MNTQNTAYSNATAFVPTMPGYDIGSTEFADMRTTEDQIHWLYYNYLTYLSSFNTSLDNLRTELKSYADTGDSDALAKAIQYTDSAIAGLKELIDQLKDISLDWDVTKGESTSSTEAHRNLFNDVSLHAIDTEELASLDITVDGLTECGLNVRGLALWSGELVEGFSPRGLHIN